MPKLKKEHTDSKKKEIFRAAWHSFMEKGYEKTTMREIAKRMDASTGILYNYFKTKEEILEEMQKRSHKRVQKRYEELRQKGTAREMLTTLFTWTLKSHSHKWAKKKARGGGGMLAEALRSEGIKKIIRSRHNQIEKYVAEIIEMGIKNGEINPHVDPKAMAGLYLALRWGLRMQMAIVGGTDVEKYRENIVKILLGNIWRDIEKKK